MREIQNCKILAQSLPHKIYDRAQLILVAGRRGYGKTTFIKNYVARVEPRVLILDPFDDFKNVPAVELDDAFDELDEFPVCRRRIVPPIDHTSREFANDFFERSINELRDCLLVLDEITLWSSSNAPGALQTLVLQGRRLGIRMIVACQRISLVPGVILSESTDLVMFRMSRPRDIHVASEWSDDETAERLRSLELGMCVHVEQ